MDSLIALFLSPLALVVMLCAGQGFLSQKLIRLAGVPLMMLLCLNTVAFSHQQSPAIAYGAGLLSAWYVIWSATLLLVYNPIMFLSAGHVDGAELYCDQHRRHETDDDNMAVQNLPKCFGWKGFLWALNLATTFRRPKIQSQVLENERPGDNSSTTQTRSFATEAEFSKRHFTVAIKGYLWVDLVHETLFGDFGLPFMDSRPRFIMASSLMRSAAYLSMSLATISLLHSLLALSVLLERFWRPGSQRLAYYPLWGPSTSLLGGLRGTSAFLCNPSYHY